MKKFLIAVPVAGVLALSGCAGMSTGEQRALSGAAIGAAAAGGIAALTDGSVGWSAAGGAAAGALGGYIYNQYEERHR